MKKSELIKEIGKVTGLTRQQADLAYNGMVQVVRETLANGNPIKLWGIGSFRLRYQPPKPDWKFGRVTAPQRERVYPVFRFTQRFKEAIFEGDCQKDPKKFMSTRRIKGGRPWELKRKHSGDLKEKSTEKTDPKTAGL